MKSFISYIEKKPVLLLGILVCAGISGSSPVPIASPIRHWSENREDGSKDVSCRPALWTDFVAFYVGNYLAHAATVVRRPGEKVTIMVLVITAALLYPPFGARRGIKAILSLFYTPWRALRGIKHIGNFCLGETRTLREATRAGALCMVVRTNNWRPRPGDEVSGALFGPPAELRRPIEQREGSGYAPERAGAAIDKEVIKSADFEVATFIPPWSLSDNSSVFSRRAWTPVGGRAVHGDSKCSEEYALAIVPSCAKVHSTNSATEVSLSQNIMKIIISLVQTLYTITTLYRSRGGQITQYGYAAFSLTVAPYAVMSVVNLLGSLCTDDYPRLYMVRSTVMDEAERRQNCHFSGVIGELEEITQDRAFECSQSTDILSARGQVKFQEAGVNNVTANFDLPDDTHVIRNIRNDLHVPKSDPIIYVPSCGILCRDGHEDEDVLKSMKIINHPPYLKDTMSLFSGRVQRALGTGLSLFVPCLPVMINGVISHFQPGNSTSAQRGWTMSWLSCSIFVGPTIEGEITRYLEREPHSNSLLEIFAVVWFILFYAAPAIGGFIVVGQMLHGFGICVRIS